MSLRVNYSKPLAYIGDLDRFLVLEKANENVDLDKLEDVSQCCLNVQTLFNILEANKDKISTIEYASSDDLSCNSGAKVGSFRELFEEWSRKSNLPLSNLIQERLISSEKVLVFNVWAPFAYFRKGFTTTTALTYPFIPRSSSVVF